MFGYRGLNYADPFGLCPKEDGGDGKTEEYSDCPEGSSGWHAYQDALGQGGVYNNVMGAVAACSESKACSTVAAVGSVIVGGIALRAASAGAEALAGARALGAGARLASGSAVSAGESAALRASTTNAGLFLQGAVEGFVTARTPNATIMDPAGSVAGRIGQTVGWLAGQDSVQGLVSGAAGWLLSR
jgi:hypothetical protein